MAKEASKSRQYGADDIVVLPDGVVRVVDNGTGIPVEVHKKTKVSTLETVMTVLHAGGKFEGDGYKISGGLHGVGASVVNALSTWLKAEVHRDGGHHVQEYAQGKKKYAVKKIGPSKLHGTIISWQADPTIFSETEYDWARVIAHLRGQAYLVKKLRLRVIDAREYAGKINLDKTFFLGELDLPVPSQTFYFEGGLLSLIKFYNQRAKPIQKNIFYIEKEMEENGGNKKVAVEIALQYIDDIDSKEISYVNNTITPEGGMHLTGFRTALTRTLNDYARKTGLVKEKDDNFTGDDVREGMVAVVSVKLRDPQFEGQTKAKLGSVEARSAVDSCFGEAFTTFLEENPDDGKMIINKVILAVRARKAAKAAKDSVLRKGALEGMTLPGKLADCASGTSAEDSELFVVEGDSAGGTAKTGRDRRTQAVLPLRGKILNIERARLDRMLASEQIKNFVIALGTAIGDTFDITKLRYHKIILASDADVDGAHIRTLLLTLLYRYYRPLLDAGHIYIAQPPLYKLRKGKEVHYAYTDQERDQVIKTLGGEIEMPSDTEGAEAEESEEGEVKAKKGPKISIQRYKGLGEMNSEELWETTMDPARRILKQVTINEAAMADQTFDILMGNDVEPRKIFIQTHAKMANLDI